MAEAIICRKCDGTNVEPGKLRSTGALHFRPSNAKFLKLKTANIEVLAHLCLDCGHVELFGDPEKVKSLTEKE